MYFRNLACTVYTFNNFSRNLALILEVFGNCNVFLVQKHIVLVTLFLLLLFYLDLNVFVYNSAQIRMSVHVGCRVEKNGYIGTVKFVGEVPPTSGNGCRTKVTSNISPQVQLSLVRIRFG